MLCKVYYINSEIFRLKQRKTLNDKIHGALEEQLLWEIHRFNYQEKRKVIKYKLCIHLKRLKDSSSINKKKQK